MVFLFTVWTYFPVDLSYEAAKGVAIEAIYHNRRLTNGRLTRECYTQHKKKHSLSIYFIFMQNN